MEWTIRPADPRSEDRIRRLMDQRWALQEEYLAALSRQRKAARRRRWTLRAFAGLGLAGLPVVTFLYFLYQGRG